MTSISNKHEGKIKQVERALCIDGLEVRLQPVFNRRGMEVRLQPVFNRRGMSRWWRGKSKFFHNQSNVLVSLRFVRPNECNLLSLVVISSEAHCCFQLHSAWQFHGFHNILDYRNTILGSFVMSSFLIVYGMSNETVDFANCII